MTLLLFSAHSFLRTLYQAFGFDDGTGVLPTSIIHFRYTVNIHLETIGLGLLDIGPIVK